MLPLLQMWTQYVMADGGRRASVVGVVLLGAWLLGGGTLFDTLVIAVGVLAVAWAAAALHPNSPTEHNKPVLAAVVAAGLFLLAEGSFLGMLEIGSMLAAFAMAISWFA